MPGLKRAREGNGLDNPSSVGDAPDHVPAKRLKPDDKYSGQMVTVKVGGEDNATDFSVHEAVLKSSLFFRGALNRAWKEGQEQEIALPDDNGQVVGDYVEWLYTGGLREDACVVQGPVHLRLDHTIDLYVFGDKILDVCFCNRIMLHLLELHHRLSNQIQPFLSAAEVCQLYERTHDGSKLRQFAVDCAIYAEMPRVSPDELIACPKAFLLDMLRVKTLDWNTPLWKGSILNAKVERWMEGSDGNVAEIMAQARCIMVALLME